MLRTIYQAITGSRPPSDDEDGEFIPEELDEDDQVIIQPSSVRRKPTHIDSDSDAPLEQAKKDSIQAIMDNTPAPVITNLLGETPANIKRGPGRPRKKPLEPGQTPPPRKTSSQSQINSIKQVKPLEERSYKEVFPDLKLNMRIVISRQSNADLQVKKGADVVGETNEGPSLNSSPDKPNLSLIPVQTVLPSIPFVPMKHVPVASFRKITQPDLEIDSTPVQAIFKRPENEYIVYEEPTEGQLDQIVEYDMDAQDKYWLATINEQRLKDLSGFISESFFEQAMDRLEKEWFSLTKDIVREKKDIFEYPEDISCAICDDGECDNSNAIVFCDECNIAVHQGMSCSLEGSGLNW